MPYLMYLFMGMIGLLCCLIKTKWLVAVLVLLCILGGAAFNAHLTFQYGKMHYDAYCTGEIHRRNERIGIPSGGDHRVEREYRFWKGSLIGLCVGVPVILLSLFGTFASWKILGYFFIMLAAWAYLPVWLTGWLSGIENYLVNPLWCMLLVLLPVVVSTVFYNVGAMVEKRKKDEQAAREAEVERLREEQKREAEERARKALEERKAKAEARALEERQAAKSKNKKKKK